MYPKCIQFIWNIFSLFFNFVTVGYNNYCWVVKGWMSGANHKSIKYLLYIKNRYLNAFDGRKTQRTPAMHKVSHDLHKICKSLWHNYNNRMQQVPVEQSRLSCLPSNWIHITPMVPFPCAIGVKLGWLKDEGWIVCNGSGPLPHLQCSCVVRT